MTTIRRFFAPWALVVLLMSGGARAQYAPTAPSGPPAGAPAASFHWETDVEAAKRLAAQSNKLVLLHFSAPWCQPCMQLEQNVFTQPAFAQTVGAKYVGVKLNCDNCENLVKLYGIDKIPMDVVLTPSGQVVQKAQSPLAMNDYLAMVQQIATRAQAPVGAVAAAGNPGAPAAPGGMSDNRYADYYNRGGQTAAPANPPASQNAPGMSQYAPQQVAATPVNPTAPPAMQAQPPVIPPANQGFAANQPPMNQPPMNQPPANTQPAGGNLAQQQFGGQQAASGGGQPQLSQNPQSTAPAAPQLPAGSPTLGLDGYCPVTLVEQQIWKQGDPRFGAIHRNRTYLFVSAAEQQRFLANPDSYSPILSGDDPVVALERNQSVPGLRKHGVFYGNRIFLFASEQSLAEFSKNPNRYVPEYQAQRTTPQGAFNGAK